MKVVTGGRGGSCLFEREVVIGAEDWKRDCWFIETVLNGRKAKKVGILYLK